MYNHRLCSKPHRKKKQPLSTISNVVKNHFSHHASSEKKVVEAPTLLSSKSSSSQEKDNFGAMAVSTTPRQANSNSSKRSVLLKEIIFPENPADFMIDGFVSTDPNDAASKADSIDDFVSAKTSATSAIELGVQGDSSKRPESPGDASFLHQLDLEGDCLVMGRTAYQYELFQVNPDAVWEDQKPVGIPTPQQKLDAFNGFFRFHAKGLHTGISDDVLLTNVRLPFFVSKEQRKEMIVYGKGSLERGRLAHNVQYTTRHDLATICAIHARRPMARGGYKEIYPDHENPLEFVWSRMLSEDLEDIVKEVQLCYLCSALSAAIPNFPRMLSSPFQNDGWYVNSRILVVA